MTLAKLTDRSQLPLSTTHRHSQSYELLLRKYMDTNQHTPSFLCPELCQWVIQCDSDQVDTSTNVTRTLRDTHVRACSHTSLPETRT